MTVLIVEDDPVGAVYLEGILAPLVKKVFRAADGKEGLMVFARNNPDVIYTDIMMPVMDGFEMLNTIRRMNPEVPAVMVSAYEDNLQLKRALEIGVSRYLLKPVNPADVEESLGACSKLVYNKRRLMEHRKFNELMLNGLPFPAVLIDTDRMILKAVNNNALELGFRPGIPAEHHFFQKEHLPESYRPVRIREVEAFTRVWDVSLVPVMPRTVLFTASDITYRKQIEEELKSAKHDSEEAYEQLKKLDIIKTGFLSTVSHELRTPLTSVLGFATMIRTKFENVIAPVVTSGEKKVVRAVDKIQRNIGIIETEAQRLTTLINDVLDITKMEAGKFEWKNEPIDMAEIIQRAAASTSSLFDAKNIPLIVDVGENVPVVYGDKDRFIQVVINLLSNAVKFTDTGNVTVTARYEKQRIEVTVTDSGIGIPREELDMIFEKFKQVGDTLDDRPRGTGLGLPICKEIVEHHGGRFQVRSTLGEGSVFTFLMPVEIPEEDAQEPEVKQVGNS